jgi:hypothetical protein
VSCPTVMGMGATPRVPSQCVKVHLAAEGGFDQEGCGNFVYHGAPKFRGRLCNTLSLILDWRFPVGWPSQAGCRKGSVYAAAARDGVAACVGAAALAAEAGDPVVVELFTSQGCSSCPPADALLSELAEHEDIIALALHVDYWDYIGWADSLARPEHTVRQKAYAAAAGKRMVYTPQFVIGGIDHVTGYRADGDGRHHRTASRRAAARRPQRRTRRRGDPDRGAGGGARRGAGRRAGRPLRSGRAGRHHPGRERGTDLRLSQRGQSLGRGRALVRRGQLPGDGARRGRSTRSSSSCSARVTGPVLAAARAP